MVITQSYQCYVINILELLPDFGHTLTLLIQSILMYSQDALLNICFESEQIRGIKTKRRREIMLQNSEGKRVPEVSFALRDGDNWSKVDTAGLFAGKTVVLFALPGAFTPTCSSTHLPRYNELAGVFKENGVDDIVCLSVNDPFVMQSWCADQHADAVTFIPDGNGEFSEGLGMLVDKSAIGFGKRSWRYSMLVKDGVIEKMFIEPEEPGDPFKVSDADTMLNYINAEAKQPKRVAMFTKPGCSHCHRAKKALSDNGMAYDEIVLGQDGLSFSTLVAVTGQGTTPQIFIDGERVGGADELETWLLK